jgi:hypothetical protein
LRRGKRYGKFGAIKSTVDGFRFASLKEARRYGALKMLQRAGKVSQLALQVTFTITVNNIKVCDYVADFTYMQNGKFIVEDVKGVRTRIYSLKKKLMWAVLNIKIKET